MEGKKRDDDFSIKMPEVNRLSPPPKATPSSRAAGLPIPVSQITNNPAVSIAAYCLASISMTVINKYCVSGVNWNMNFFFLAFQVCLAPLRTPVLYLTVLQSVVCIIAIMACKSMGLIKDLARFDGEKAKKCKLAPAEVCRNSC
jgi:GDP-mannose transporter